MPEAIAIPKMTAMQRLALAQTSLDALKKETKQWKKEYDLALSDVLRVATFAPDKFLDTIKRKGDSYPEGDYKLIRQPTVKRVLRREEFIESHEDLFKKIGEIPLGVAEDAIGKDALDALCDEKVTYRYLVIDMKLPENGGI